MRIPPLMTSGRSVAALALLSMSSIHGAAVKLSPAPDVYSSGNLDPQRSLSPSALVPWPSAKEVPAKEECRSPPRRMVPAKEVSAKEVPAKEVSAKEVSETPLCSEALNWLDGQAGDVGKRAGRALGARSVVATSEGARASEAG